MSTRCEVQGCRRRRREHPEFCPFHALDPSAVNESQLRTAERKSGRNVKRERQERRRKTEARRIEDRLLADVELAGEAVRGILEDLALPEAHIEILVDIARNRVIEGRISTARKSLTRADADSGSRSLTRD